MKRKKRGEKLPLRQEKEEKCNEGRIGGGNELQLVVLGARTEGERRLRQEREASEEDSPRGSPSAPCEPHTGFAFETRQFWTSSRGWH